MKALCFLISLFMINACKTQTGNVISSDNTTMAQNHSKESGCPEDGTCTVVVHKNKKLSVKDDGTGALYPDMEEGNDIVIEYTYHRAGPAGTADADFSETIHFQIPSALNLSKQNERLSDVNLLYGRHCFCVDAGYHIVTKGKLLVEKTADGFMFDLNFNVRDTPQIISHIREIVKL